MIFFCEELRDFCTLRSRQQGNWCESKKVAALKSLLVSIFMRDFLEKNAFVEHMKDWKNRDQLP